MALAVCLLLDAAGDRAVRQLWARLEADGVSTLLTHTHRRHVPHLSYALLRSYDPAAVEAALERLPAGEPLRLRFDTFGTFRRSRCWLGPAATVDLAARQQAVVAALEETGAELHRNYRAGVWTPHVTLAPRLHLHELGTVAAAVYDVLPLDALAPAVELIDTSTGARHRLSHVV